jgi:hypothetical protein
MRTLDTPMAARNTTRDGLANERAESGEGLVYALYEALIRARPRLARLSPLVAADLRPVAHALHEVVWFFLTPTTAPMPGMHTSERVKADLARTARDRSSDVYTTAVAALAVKLSRDHARQPAASLIEDIQDGLDSLTFDFRATKAVTLERLDQIKAHLEDRIAHVKQSRRTAFRFNSPPEKYKDRKTKTESPERFLRRVYGADLQRGFAHASARP